MPLIAAGIGAVASTGLSWLSGKKAKKQAKKAAAAQAKQSAANSALSKVIYGDTKELYAPSAAQGQMAGNTLMALLGLGGSGGGGGGAAPGGSALSAYTAPSAQQQLDYALRGSADVIGPKRTKKILKHGGSPEEQLRYAQSLMKPGERTQFDAWMMSQEPSIYEQAGLGTNGMGTAEDPKAAAQSALDTYLNSINYQFGVDEGAKAVNNLWAGDFESGAAGKALQAFGQDKARYEGIGPYMEALARQQGVGLNSVSGIANAGQNMYGQVSGQGQMATDARMNQYGVGAQAAQNTYGAAAKGIGQVAGAAFGGTGFGGSSYGGGTGGMTNQQYALLNQGYGSQYGG
jgi:hypothetical protein